MANKNELILINKILRSEITIRKAAKNFGLRRDDFVLRIKEMLKNDKENLRRLEIILITNKILFENFKIDKAAMLLGISVKELDKEIKNVIKNNKEKCMIYNSVV